MVSSSTNDSPLLKHPASIVDSANKTDKAILRMCRWNQSLSLNPSLLEFYLTIKLILAPSTSNDSAFWLGLASLGWNTAALDGDDRVGALAVRQPLRRSTRGVENARTKRARRARAADRAHARVVHARRAARAALARRHRRGVLRRRSRARRATTGDGVRRRATASDVDDFEMCNIRT